MSEDHVETPLAHVGGWALDVPLIAPLVIDFQDDILSDTLPDCLDTGLAMTHANERQLQQQPHNDGDVADTPLDGAEDNVAVRILNTADQGSAAERAKFYRERAILCLGGLASKLV
ncbi:hypothetical protein CMQ_6663 [Grosmannia clavigera kw1407]|uniref:Uncharacterized protein n=1 Tax=Grosmannia clavigera (strain kw1407 / UAMH 11150) TaxID=655863 RepID=F0X6Y1_GROCL|nr:uncharacterized protein CMQ_6663 [Grosmannia clavigera kw1407]EFX06342.1 hypothetical protein CMQ_6663 [Grosmannia clavigera kw1407]